MVVRAGKSKNVHQQQIIPNKIRNNDEIKNIGKNKIYDIIERNLNFSINSTFPQVR